MSAPGPPDGLWALSLLLWAASAVVVGEALRSGTSRWVRFWRAPEPIERSLIDLYLGGASLYLLAAVQLGAFVAPLVQAVPVIASAYLLYRVATLRRHGAADRVADRIGAAMDGPWPLIAVGSAAALFGIQLAAALPVGTGNTYDSSLFATYVALLLQHGSVPLSFQPYGAAAILYPQGTTVWLAWAQLDFGLPAARTALLVTPLFLALPPLSGYVLGRSWLRSPKAGAALAVAFAFLGPSTRSLVGGSNDFAVAFPLVILLAARSTIWFDVRPPSWPDALAYGVLVGYSAVLNVTGAEWLLLALLIAGVVGRPSPTTRSVGWLARWASLIGLALAAGIPSLYVLARARLDPALLAGELPSHGPVGIGLANLVGSLDPFLFRSGDVELSPVPLLRLELAVLLVLGVAVLLAANFGDRQVPAWSTFGPWIAACGVATGLWLVLEFAAGVAGSPVRGLAFVTSGPQTSLWLFAVYGIVAALPLALAFERGGLAAPEAVRRPIARSSRRGPGSLGSPILPVVFAVAVVVPAVVLAPSSLGPVLASTYADFGNVSAADFALLSYAGAHLSPGERVLVAPGSAGEFLPGYARGIVLLYPMAPGWSRVNLSYGRVVGQLTNGTLNLSGREALAALAVDVVVVTGNNTVLWPAFWAYPLLQAEANGTATFPVLWHEGDAWLFNASACRAGSPGCS